MSNPKMISINLKTARQLARLLDRLEESSCRGCTGGGHGDACPASEAYQLRNYLTQRINNPGRHFTV